jgi:hypothetical protein
MIGKYSGFMSTGELRQIWERGLKNNQLCGCGVPFRSCEFWRSVLDRELEGIQYNIDEIIKQKNKIDRMRYIPKLINPFRNLKASELEYLELILRLYRSISEISGSEYIIDSSKDASYAYLLGSLIPKVDVWYVHLVRDSRAVAYSWQRQRRRPEIYWKLENMPIYNPIKSSLEWVVFNSIIAMLQIFHKKRYMYIRYEDLLNNPLETLDKILRWVGIPKKEKEFVDGEVLDLDANHTVSGNPIRFNHGKIRLSVDNEWIWNMNKAAKLQVTGLTWPLLLHFGYKIGQYME